MQQVKIGGSENSVSVGRIGFGLMGMTWRPKQTPDEQAFAAMKTALEIGCTCWNSGEFYGTPEPTLNLDLLKRYFDKYPEDAPKVIRFSETVSLKKNIFLIGF